MRSERHSAGRLPPCWVAMLLLSLWAPRCAAQAQNEYMLRAAYVFNLAKYVEWPQATAELNVGVVGDAVMGETLEKVLSGKALGGRTIHVWLSPSDELLQRCDLVYVTQASAKHTQSILEKLKTRSVLTVGESEGFTREGGVIALIRTGDQIQIQVNMSAAREAQLKISSRLLNLSTVVVTNGKN